MRARTKARRFALQMSFQVLDQKEPASDLPALYQKFWATAGQAVPAAVKKDSESLVEGLLEHRQELDALVQAHTQGWKLGRMARVDLSILRLGVFELSYRPDVPVSVVLNEAIDLAKEFSTAESGAFVNGILDAIAHQKRDL